MITPELRRLTTCLLLTASMFPYAGCASTGAMPEWAKDASMYEVNVRQFSESSSFKEVEKALPALKEMGVEIIWFMPIQPIGEKNRKGSLGSYYSIKDYTAINAEFGSADDFKAIVDKAHNLGMKVILDWVANHTAWDHHWTETNPEFYNLDEEGNFKPPVEDWADVIDINYDNAELRKAMIGEMAWWITEFDIDGFRCDVAEEVPLDFWKQATDELQKVKNILMLAEGEKPELHDNGFHLTYAWRQIHMIREVSKGDKNAKDLLDNQIWEQDEAYPEEAVRLKFITNHDENTWHATIQEDFGKGADAFMVWATVSRGMPLIYTGQETGLDKQLEFFEHDPVQWQANHPQRAFLTKLMKLKSSNQALWNGQYGGKVMRLNFEQSDPDLYAIMREKNGHRVVAFLNLSNSSLQTRLDDSTVAGEYTNPMTGGSERLTGRDRIRLNPWEYKIYSFTPDD